MDNTGAQPGINISVGGDMQGHIVIGDGNTIIEQAAIPPQLSQFSPQPPPEPEDFVGRKDELQKIESWIANRQLAIINGLDGIGKTSLISRVANGEAAKAQPNGVVFLSGLDEEEKLLEFDDVIQRLFDSLYEANPEYKVNLASAQKYLSNTQPLVLLNSVKLTPQNLKQLRTLFPKAPILVTTENTVLGMGEKNRFSLGPLDRESSLALLASLSIEEDQPILAQIADLLENIPAALRLVANIMLDRGLKADAVLAGLQSCTPSEQNKAKAALERAFIWVYSALGQEERDMLDQVAASFGVSVDRPWLEKVCGGSAVSERLESLELLHAHSPRLGLMAGLRPLLLQGKDLTRQRERLLTHLLSELKTRWNDFDFIRDELGNLLGLLAWAAANGQWANVAALGRGIDPYLTLRGLWNSWRNTLGHVQQAAEAMKDLALQGWVLHQLATYEFGMGNLSAAQGYLQQAISIRKQIGDTTGLSYSQHNLDVINAMVPAVKPSSRSSSGSLRKWVTGGIVALAAAAVVSFLVYGAAQKSPPVPTAVPTVTAGEVKVVVPPPATETMTASETATQTAPPSPTVTATFTPSPTDTPTATLPAYAPLTGIVVNDTAACFYGPGTMYLSKGTRRIAGNTVDVLGRIETDKGIWVKNKFTLPRIDASDPCWMNAKYLNITPEQLMSVPLVDPNDPKQYNLPGDRISRGRTLEDPVVTSVTDTGSLVNIKWNYFDVGVGEYPNHDEKFYRYLIEAWVCKNGEIVFTPSGWGPYPPDVIDGMTVSAQIKDEPGCTEPSHARLYLAWAHGYVGPTEIKPWRQSGAVASTPTP